MADRFWVGDGGNWSDNTNHWSASSGGAPNASKPTSSDNVYFDANSFSTGSQTVTIDETAYCADMDWTGATDNPTLDFSTNLDAYGDVTLIAAMSITGIAYLNFPSGAQSLTTNGTALTSAIKISGSDLTLVDDLVVRAVAFSAGSFIAVDRTITASHDILITGAGAKTLTFGATIITSASWQYTGSNLTVTANTATIKITGTGALNGGSVDYNGASFELNGTAHTISGDNTFDKLKLAAGSVITITPGSTQTIRKLITPSTATNVTTIQTGGASATIQGHRGYCELNHVDLTSIVAGEKYRYYAGDNSTDGGGNTNWIFTRKIRPWGRFW